MRAALCVLICLGLGALFSGPAAAAGSELGLSRDGETFTPTLPGSLFDPGVRWVPGDVRTASFYVRNEADTQATLRIDARTADPDDLLDNDDMRLEARLAGSAWQRLESGRLTTEALEVAEAVRVDVRAAFDPAATNETQASSVALRFLVTLSGDTEVGSPAAPATPSAPDPATGGLPGTGGVVRPWMLWLAAVLVGAGLALMHRNEHEEETDGTHC